MGLTQKQLNLEAQLCAQKIINAELNVDYFETPYKHLVIDEFFSDSLASECLKNFPDINDSSWEHANEADGRIGSRARRTGISDHQSLGYGAVGRASLRLGM